MRRSPYLPGAVKTADRTRPLQDLTSGPDARSGPAGARLGGVALGDFAKPRAPGVAIDVPLQEPEPTRGWAILLYMSPGDPQKAMLALDRVKTRAGLSGAYLETQKDSHMVLLGSFDQPSSEEAQAELSRIRSIEVEGSRPFAQASLVPPPAVLVVGGAPEFNLGIAKRAQGRNAVYTLQVGAYERGDGKSPTSADLVEIRKAAEDAALALRKDGEEAYYYHGRTRSMVTLGIFGTNDYDERNPGAGDAPGLQYARAKHPNNLVNGQGVRERVGADGKWRLQPSMVVAIPEE